MDDDDHIVKFEFFFLIWGLKRNLTQFWETKRIFEPRNCKTKIFHIINYMCEWLTTPLGREWVNIHPCWVSRTGAGREIGSRGRGGVSKTWSWPAPLPCVPHWVLIYLLLDPISLFLSLIQTLYLVPLIFDLVEMNYIWFFL